MRKIIVLIFILGFVQICSAQYDDWSFVEIYLKDGSVLKGQAKIPIIQGGKSTLQFTKEKLRYRTSASGSEKIDPKVIDKIIFNVKPDKGVKTKRTVKGNPRLFIVINKNNKKTKLGFAEVIVDGEVKLVKRKVQNASNNRISVYNELLLIKNDEKAVLFNYAELKSFKKRAIEYFNDCHSLVEKISSKSFRKKDLEYIVKYYNTNCAK